MCKTPYQAYKNIKKTLIVVEQYETKIYFKSDLV